MKDFMAKGIIVLLVLVIAAAITYGSFKWKRWLHWGFGYSSKVEEIVKPLEKRLESLEKRVKILEQDTR